MTRYAQLVSAAFLVVLRAVVVDANPASPDPSFGGHGFVTGPALVANAVVEQPDGKLVVAGTDTQTSFPVFATARYLTDGTLDPTFGGGDGVAESPAGSDERLATRVALQPDGKIVVGGYAGGAPGSVSLNFVAMRYAPDGTPDATFGGDGSVATDLGHYDRAYAMALQPDGKIVLGGGYGGYPGEAFALVRYLPDGTLDSTFDGDGIVITPLSGGSTVLDMAVQPDGKIVAVGTNWYGGAGGRIELVRYLADGTLDTTFGASGLVLTDPSPLLDVAFGVALQPDGKIVVAGVTNTADIIQKLGALTVLRYLPTGTLDPTFDGDGIATAPLPLAVAQGIVLQPDGRIVVAGTTEAGPQAIALARFEPNGSLEPSLGVTTTRPPGESTAGSGVTVTAGGQIVVVGTSGPLLGLRKAIVVRYGTPGPVCWDGRVEGAEECDDANYLDGDCCSASCTLDPAGTACTPDASPCTLDQCNGAGTCLHPPDNDGGPCDDGDICTQDACQGGVCVGTAEPAPFCRDTLPPARGSLLIRDAPDPQPDRLWWRWTRGEATTPAEFAEQDYTVCVYDASAAPQPIAHLATAGPYCGGFNPCWKLKGSQPIYVDKAGTHDGLSEIFFSPGADTRARFRLRAIGSNFSTPALPLVPPVTAQLHSEAGQCWTATYSAPAKSTATVFRAKPD
jgi:uncharacterized delta-60 repeat protein